MNRIDCVGRIKRVQNNILFILPTQSIFSILFILFLVVRSYTFILGSGHDTWVEKNELRGIELSLYT